MRLFKIGLAKSLVVPKNYVVRPLTYYSRGRVLGEKERYYQIDSYSVIREGTEMKIIGFRLLNGLF
jgi:hypothetical protein